MTHKKLAVLTSGGDAPGMNAALRAVVRSAAMQGVEVLGVQDGFAGLIHNRLQVLSPRDVGGILHLGGTILGSARAPEFAEEAVRHDALRHLNQANIDALIVIGGNGSQTGAYALAQMDFPVLGITSTIDNDVLGCDVSIGVDTALNIALEAIDRLKVTASSHKRAIVVETMGRHCGYLALMAGITGGAEAIVIPELEISPEEIIQSIHTAYEKGKPHALIVVAEGARYDAARLKDYIEAHERQAGFKVRVTTLGFVQRGGAPTAFDRFLATRLGVEAVSAYLEGRHCVVLGHNGGEITYTPMEKVAGKTKGPDLSLLKMAAQLSR